MKDLELKKIIKLQHAISRKYRFEQNSPTIAETKKIFEQIQLHIALVGDLTEESLQKIVFRNTKNTIMMITQAVDTSSADELLEAIAELLK